MLNQYRYHFGQFKLQLNTFLLSGSDVFTFLQSQSTYDISLISSGEFHLVSFLDPQGRTESYGWLLNLNDEYLYLVPEFLGASSLERLNKFLISEDVIIEGPQLENWWVALGPKSENIVPSVHYKGEMFDEKAFFFKSSLLNEVSLIPTREVNTWRCLSGWPSFDGKEFSKDLINNQRLYDLALKLNKGCYPGQETVSKIATGRGAAYAPVLLEVSRPIPSGEIKNYDKKIGIVGECHEWQGKYFLAAHLLRDFRVAGMKVHFSLNETSETGTVHYYPLLSGSEEIKAQELFYEATDYFKEDDNVNSELFFRKAIDLNPNFSDAYEALGVLLGRLERFQEAIELMKQLSNVDPHSVLAHTNMSLYLMRLGKIDEAEEQKSMATVKSFQMFGQEAKYKEALKKESEAQQEEWKQRESMFLQVLEIDQDDTLANYGVGSIAVERGQFERAKTHLEKVLEADPKYSVAYLALGKAYMGLNLKDKAKHIWKEGVTVAAAKGDLMPANQMQAELERF